MTMKRFTLIAIFCIAISTISCAQPIVEESRTLPRSRVPMIPTELDFAGERVPLDNFDTKESLRRELLTTSYLHSRTFLTLLATTRYFPIIEPILAKYNIPDDFKYLCMAESGLNPNVMSHAGAAGLWQFMPATGKSHGLLTGKEVDKRYHIEKSTEAACKHLLASYKRFGSWTLAAAAYNLGDAGLQRRVSKQGITNYYDTFLPEETLRYVFRILTFKLLTLNPSAYGFVIGKEDYDKPLDQYTIVKVATRTIDWSKFAKANGTTYKMLRQLNHWIRDYDYNNSSLRELSVKIPTKEFRTEK